MPLVFCYRIFFIFVIKSSAHEKLLTSLLSQFEAIEPEDVEEVVRLVEHLVFLTKFESI
jgi:hypothetical protein